MMHDRGRKTGRVYDSLIFFLHCLPVIAIPCFSCNTPAAKPVAVSKDSIVSCMKVPARFGADTNYSPIHTSDTATTGMRFIKGGEYMMGADNDQASPDE